MLDFGAGGNFMGMELAQSYDIEIINKCALVDINTVDGSALFYGTLPKRLFLLNFKLSLRS